MPLSHWLLLGSQLACLTQAVVNVFELAGKKKAGKNYSSSLPPGEVFIPCAPRPSASLFPSFCRNLLLEFVPLMPLRSRSLCRHLPSQIAISVKVFESYQINREFGENIEAINSKLAKPPNEQ
ncbi:hypothetical protein B0T18DRAFT_405831 [Schizothecium vesticola]|uniref:Secreted protein n=1 Tax=Schizothecium vesticola TaxID=314040 RepID=A0AA40F0X4_9PEZI|nr:hypothetical protein B0T18DRAFT_405831 [Schizothecium vesticola]